MDNKSFLLKPPSPKYPQDRTSDTRAVAKVPKLHFGMRSDFGTYDAKKVLSEFTPDQRRTPTATAKWPFLALGPTSRTIAFRGYDGGQPFTISSAATDPAIGIATLADLDIIDLFVTVQARQVNASETPDARFELTAGDIFRFTGKAPGGKQRTNLVASLNRLHATKITTDLGPRGRRALRTFRFVEGFEILGNGSYVLTPTPWLAEQVLAKSILKVDRGAALLRGLARRIYLWARSHAGGQGFERWSITLPLALHKAASADDLRRFRQAVRAIAAANSIPGFRLSFASDTLTIAREGTQVPARRPAPLILNLDLPPDEAEAPSAHTIVLPGFFTEEANDPMATEPLLLNIPGSDDCDPTAST